MSYLLKALTETPNPIGEVYQLPEVEEYLVTLANKWEDEVVSSIDKKWYDHFMFWKWGRSISLHATTKFLIGALDELINIVDDKIDLGPDKKATVLNAIGRLYDYVIREAIPIWLRPFAGRVKDYIINTLISTAIDWIVEHYRNGSWRNKLESEGNTE